MVFISETNSHQFMFILMILGCTQAQVTRMVNDTRSALITGTSISCNKECDFFNISSTYTSCVNSGDQDCIETRPSICLYNSTSSCEWSTWRYFEGTCPNGTSSRTKIHYQLLNTSIDICSQLNQVQKCYTKMSCGRVTYSENKICSECTDCDDNSCHEIIKESSCQIYINILSNNNSRDINLIARQISSSQIRKGCIVINGNWSAWTGWKCGTCNGQCNNGTQTCIRSRTCDNPKPEYGGKNCSGESTEMRSQSCQLQPCPVNGNWSEWSRWSYSVCTGQCNNGTQTSVRIRKCDNPKPEYGGKNCSGESIERRSQSCQLQPCPAKVQWSMWSKWTMCTNCSSMCGNGTITCGRTRQCTYLGTEGGSSQCEGSNLQLKEFPCSLKSSLANVQWSKWSEWTSCTNCSGLCDNGTKTCARTRHCIYTGTPCEGSQCEGTNIQLNEIPCQLNPCAAPEQESLSAVIASVIGAIGGILFAVIVIIFLIFIVRRLNPANNRNQNKTTEMNDMRNIKDGEETYEGFSNRRSIHVYGTLNESKDNNTTEMKPQDSEGGHYFALEKESENVTINRNSNNVVYDYTTGNEIMIASQSNTDQTYHVLENDLKSVDKSEKPEGDNPDDSNYFILEQQ